MREGRCFKSPPKMRPAQCAPGRRSNFHHASHHHFCACGRTPSGSRCSSSMVGEVKQLDRFGDAVERLERLREFVGPERLLWFHLLTAMAGVSGARLGVVLRVGPEQEPGWETVIHWPSQGVDESELRAFAVAAGDLAETCVQQGEALRGARTANGIDWCVGVRVTLEGEPGALVLAFLVEGAMERDAVEALRRLRLPAPMPTLYRLRQQMTDSETAVGHFAAVLDLVSPLNPHRRFFPV